MRPDGSLPRGTSDTAAMLGCKPDVLAPKPHPTSHGLDPAVYRYAPFRQSSADFWTAERNTTFQGLVENGRMKVSTEDASEALGTNRWRIRSRMAREGIKPHQDHREEFTEADRDFLRRHTDEFGQLTISTMDAAFVLKSSPHPVYRLLEEMGIKRPPPQAFWTEANIAALKALLDDEGSLTCSLKEAAAKLGCDHTTVFKALLRLKKGLPLG